MSGYNKHRHYSDKKATFPNTFIAKVPIVLLTMILSGLLLLLVSAFLVLNSESPLILSTPLSLTALYLCSFIGGIVCSLMFDNPQSYIGALLASSAFTVIILIMKITVPQAPSAPQIMISIILHTFIIVACFAGVFLTERIRYQNTRRHKIRR